MNDLHELQFISYWHIFQDHKIGLKVTNGLDEVLDFSVSVTRKDICCIDASISSTQLKSRHDAPTQSGYQVYPLAGRTANDDVNITRHWQATLCSQTSHVVSHIVLFYRTDRQCKIQADIVRH